jgi:hypothetical protein
LFEREHHRRIASVLESFDAGLLAAHHCLFGGGTAIVLRNGEYRESQDLDFLVSSLEGYRALRQRLTGKKGIQALARPGATLEALREVRADQYGLRTMLRVEDLEIKFEIVFEGRITLEPPGNDDQLCGVATLTLLDMATSKLLANSDRWADDAVQSRDLIDLAMLNPPRKLLAEAIAKAKAAYGDSIDRDLGAAIDRVRRRPARLDDCMQALQMTTVPKALLWQRIKTLDRRRTANR